MKVKLSNSIFFIIDCIRFLWYTGPIAGLDIEEAEEKLKR